MDGDRAETQHVTFVHLTYLHSLRALFSVPSSSSLSLCAVKSLLVDPGISECLDVLYVDRRPHGLTA